MHFKDFTDQFYQYPHQISYAQLLKSHQSSFESFERNFESSSKKLPTVPRGNKPAFSGKILKNIFTQLKNKTSTELETFIDVSSINNTTTAYQKGKVWNSAVQDRNTTTKSIQVVEENKYMKNRSSNEIAITNPEVQICLNSQEVGNSIKFKATPKETYTEKEKNSKFELTHEANSLQQVHDGKVFEVYNVFKKVISSVKWKCKKCRTTKDQTDPAPAVEGNASTVKPKEQADSCACNNDTCDPETCEKCGQLKKQRLPNGGCNCWRTEEETLFCLLKLEARENFKQIKQIERELQIQRKALRVLNKKCSNLENVVKKNGVGNDNSKKSVQEIFAKPANHTEKRHGTTRVNRQRSNSDEHNKPMQHTSSMNTNIIPPLTILRITEVTQDNANTSGDITHEKNTENLTHENSEGSAVEHNTSILKTEEISTPKNKSNEILDNSKTTSKDPKLVIDNIPVSKAIAGSKVKITISRSTVVINTSSDEDSNAFTAVEKSGSNDNENISNSNSSSIDSNISKQEQVPCECRKLQLEDNEPCTCPSKKSSFVIKLFRKKKCDDQCKCCIKTKPNPKKCKYYLEKKHKSKPKTSSSD